MKTGRLIVCLILTLAVLVFVGGSAAEKEPFVPGEDEEIYGTWVNTDYRGVHEKVQKRINYPDGRFEMFRYLTSTHPYNWGTYTFEDKWTGPEGNVWYKRYCEQHTGVKDYTLDKISNSGRTWEFVSTHEDYPTEMDPNYWSYCIYYREEAPGEFIASKVEDLVGIWETRFGGRVAYMQFEADGTLNLASTVEMLKQRATLILSGTFWFEGAVFHMKDNHVYGTGTYEVRVQKDEDKPIHLSFVVIDDPSRGRVADLTEGMSRIEL